jgi:hypothetical protein
MLIRLREQALEKTITTRCLICNVSKTTSAKRGQQWFKKHVTTKAHLAAVAKRA